MSQFDPKTIDVMRSVLEEVCSHVPAHAPRPVLLLQPKFSNAQPAGSKATSC